VAREAAGARQTAARTRAAWFRRPSLRMGKPRKLAPEEAAALAARPWPRLPWWLWAAVVVGVIGLVLAALGLLGQGSPDLPRLGERRTPPAAGLTHDLGRWQAAALEPNAPGRSSERFVRAAATCPRLAGLALAGTQEQVALLRLATDQVCALRSVGGIDQARTALREAGAVVTFATFERSGNESAALIAPPPGRQLALGSARVAVLINPKFVLGNPAEASRRIAVLLVHEGAHLAGGNGAPDAAAELNARKAEVAACDRLFPPGQQDPRPSRGCEDTRELLRLGDAGALAELRASGYR
jgi:hypothetical protein